MLNKKCLISTGALALAMMPLASPAAAQTFSPAPNTFTLSGLLNLQQTVNLDCQVDVDISVNSSGAPTVTGRSFSPGNPACGLVITAFGSWSVNPDNPTQVTATVGATSFAGSCSGSITGTWSNATQSVTFTNASVPGTPVPCIVNGTLTSSDPNVRIP